MSVDYYNMSLESDGSTECHIGSVDIIVGVDHYVSIGHHNVSEKPL